MKRLKYFFMIKNEISRTLVPHYSEKEENRSWWEKCDEIFQQFPWCLFMIFHWLLIVYEIEIQCSMLYKVP